MDLTLLLVITTVVDCLRMFCRVSWEIVWNFCQVQWRWCLFSLFCLEAILYPVSLFEGWTAWGIIRVWRQIAIARFSWNMCLEAAEDRDKAGIVEAECIHAVDATVSSVPFAMTLPSLFVLLASPWHNVSQIHMFLTMFYICVKIYLRGPVLKRAIAAESAAGQPRRTTCVAFCNRTMLHNSPSWILKT